MTHRTRVLVLGHGHIVKMQFFFSYAFNEHTEYKVMNRKEFHVVIVIHWDWMGVLIIVVYSFQIIKWCHINNQVMSFSHNGILFPNYQVAILPFTRKGPFNLLVKHNWCIFLSPPPSGQEMLSTCKTSLLAVLK